MAKAAFTEIPRKVEDALKAGSDEFLDLADNFRQISLYVDGILVVASYYEQLATVGLGDRVSSVIFCKHFKQSLRPAVSSAYAKCQKVVDEFSAFLPYPKADPPQPINSDYINMVKFEGANNSTFEDARSILLRWETKFTQQGNNNGF